VIATHVRDAEVCLDVTDTGHGMTPGVLSVAFDEGFTTKPAGRGRGIGLFLSKTLMTQANGRIEATSIPDVGTTMTLVLPPAVRDEGGR
jgi:signal transduction histidine kinase